MEKTFTVLDAARFNQWAGAILKRNLEQVAADLLRDVVVPPWQSMADLIWHIHAVQELWLARVRGDSNARLIEKPGDGTLSFVIQKCSESSQQLVVQAEIECMQPLSLRKFTTMDGETFEESVENIYMHVMNHNSFHRGQIMSVIRTAYDGPLQSLDLIRYLQFARD